MIGWAWMQRRAVRWVRGPDEARATTGGENGRGGSVHVAGVRSPRPGTRPGRTLRPVRMPVVVGLDDRELYGGPPSSSQVATAPRCQEADSLRVAYYSGALYSGVTTGEQANRPRQGYGRPASVGLSTYRIARPAGETPACPRQTTPLTRPAPGPRTARRSSAQAHEHRPEVGAATRCDSWQVHSRPQSRASRNGDRHGG
jgi:hypothetical protein